MDDSNVTAPAHYAGDGEVECRRAQLSMASGYDRAACPSCVAHWALTAVKYLWRAPLKNGLQDYRKAREYLDYIIDYMEGEHLMALPERTPEQRQLDLAAAAAVRQARKNIKRDLKDGRIDLEHAIALPVMQRVRVRDLIRALPGVGEVAADEAMRELSIAENRRVQGLGANQLAGLLEWWDGRNKK